MISAQVSLTGPKGANQDSVLAPLVADSLTITGVADGVGGHADGKFASETVITAIERFFKASPKAPIKDGFEYARQCLSKAASQYPLSRNMATTLSVVRLNGTSAEVGHVGDSRVYHLRNNGLLSRTIDQTEIAELVRQSVFTPEEALRYPRRNVLISSISVDGEFDFYGTSFDTKPGDGILICTDGFYNSVKKAELIELFLLSPSAEEFMRRAASCASTRGIRDDATAVVMFLD